jgi:effector-binding domain-containing protein
VLALQAIDEAPDTRRESQMFRALRLLLLAAIALFPLALPAQTPPTAPRPGDVFGQEVQLTERPVIYFNGEARWDSAYDTLVDAFKTVHGYLERQGIKPAGNAMTIYKSADDRGFQFWAAVPVESLPANPPQGDIAAGKTPAGRAFRFVHRGSYDAMDTTYEAITNFFDERNMEAQDTFIEEYETDLRTTPEDKLVVIITVPVK